MIKRTSSVIMNAAVLLLAGSAIAWLLLSLRWPIVHDLPVLLYEGYLIKEIGLVPYRDFFDMNPPGTMMLYSLLHQITDGESLACRLMDIATLIAIGIFTCIALRRNGWKAGVLAWSCFTIAYLSIGTSMTLQRELFCVLFVAISAAIMWGRKDNNTLGWLSFVVCGLLAGMAISIKPPMFLCWPPLLLGIPLSKGLNLKDRMPNHTTAMLRAIAQFLLGMIVFLTFVVAWLAHNNALGSFWDMARHYYPLYTQIGPRGGLYERGIVAFLDRYVILTLQVPMRSTTVILAFMGIMSACRSRDRRLIGQAVAVSIFAITTLLYVPISGKFWLYHQIPLFYGLGLCAGFVVDRRLACHARARIGLSLLVFAAVMVILPLANIKNELTMWKKGKIHPVKNGIVEKITLHLRNHTDPSDTILPLDVTRGAIHVLYNLRRPLYGRFIYDFHFYHHVKNPYIAKMRKELLAEFTNDAPEVVLVFKSWRPHGRTCSQEFPELEDILRLNYVVTMETDHASILRRTAGQNEKRGQLPEKMP